MKIENEELRIDIKLIYFCIFNKEKRARTCTYENIFVSLHAQNSKLMYIVSTTSLPIEGFARLREHHLVMPIANQLPDVAEAEVLISTFDYRVGRDIIEHAPKLRLIANFGVGFNNIDLDACRERGIRVTNTPLPVIEPTAELAFALMHDVARRTSLFDRQLRSHCAEPFGVMNNLGHSLYGKVLGIIGMGRIGQALARRAIASGMTIIYHNRHEIPAATLAEKGIQAQFVEQEELLEKADYVSLNLPYTADVHHIIGYKQLRMMKPTAYLINTARGAHVDENALVKALQNGEIAGAAMDVYEHEPQISPELLNMDNVVLSPHTGTGTWEGRLAMCENVTDNILAFAKGDLEHMDIVL